MALVAHRTSGSGHTASPSTSTATATAATMNTTTSPPSPAAPPDPAGPIGPWCTTNSTCFSDLKPLLIVMFGFTSVAICLVYAARFLLYCLDRHRRRVRQPAREPKPPSDADDADGTGSAGDSPVWAEAECAICLAEFIDDDVDGLEEGGGEAERVRVRVLPACGHGFHAACVEAWLATRASCPTCRAPSSSRSRPSSRATTTQP